MVATKFTAKSKSTLIFILIQASASTNSAPDFNCTQDDAYVDPCYGNLTCEANEALSDMKDAILKIVLTRNLATGPKNWDEFLVVANTAFANYVPSLTNLNPDPNGIRFYFYNDPTNASSRVEITYDDENSIKSSGYNRRHRLIMITHGYMGDTLSHAAEEIKNAYFSAGYAGNNNIVVMDWSAMSGPPNYSSNLLGTFPTYALAARNVYPASTRVTSFLEFMNGKRFLRRRQGAVDLHLVGHSLGAHVMGLGAQQFTNLTSVSVFRLTGTEPAGPIFLNKPPCQRFNSKQALMVDAIHTNYGEFGIGAVAKVDFMVNGGGLFQPQCLLPGATVETIPYCSHRKAPALYALSIKQDIYGTCSPNTICKPAMAFMGENLSNCASGTYNVEFTDVI